VIVEPGGFEGEQLGCLQFGPGVGERMRDGLVLADRAVEDAPIGGVG